MSSDAVQITYKKGQGRFATAARDIEVGELIAAETAFVACLDKGNEYVNHNLGRFRIRIILKVVSWH